MLYTPRGSPGRCRAGSFVATDAQIVEAVERWAVADWNDVPTGSMRPTIREGDRILVNKLAYGLRMPFTDGMSPVSLPVSAVAHWHAVI